MIGNEIDGIVIAKLIQNIILHIDQFNQLLQKQNKLSLLY